MIKTFINIVGAPRSGTSWLGQIFNSSPEVAYRFQPLFSHEFKAQINSNSTKHDITNFYKELENTSDEFVLQKKNINGNSIDSFEKLPASHLVMKHVRYHNVLKNLMGMHEETMIIAIIRNPNAVINSWYKAPKEFDKSWTLKEEWRFAERKNLNKEEEFNGFEKWKESSLIFENLANQFPRRVKIVKYSNMVADTMETVEDLFHFSGLNFGKQTQEFINKSSKTSSEDPYGVYRKNVDVKAWENELDPDITDFIQKDLAGTSLEKYLYDT